MKYGIRNIGKTTVVILNLIQNLVNYWLPNQVRDDKEQQDFPVCHSRLDRESSLKISIRKTNDKIAHISYSLFHLSNFKRLKGAL